MDPKAERVTSGRRHSANLLRHSPWRETTLVLLRVSGRDKRVEFAPMERIPFVVRQSESIQIPDDCETANRLHTTTEQNRTQSDVRVASRRSGAQGDCDYALAAFAVGQVASEGELFRGLIVVVIRRQGHGDRFEKDRHDQVVVTDLAKGLPAGRAGIVPVVAADGFVVAVAAAAAAVAGGRLGPKGMGGQIAHHAVLVKDVLAGVGNIVGPDDRVSHSEILETNNAGSGDFCGERRGCVGGMFWRSGIGSIAFVQRVLLDVVETRGRRRQRQVDPGGIFEVVGRFACGVSRSTLLAGGFNVVIIIPGAAADFEFLVVVFFFGKKILGRQSVVVLVAVKGPAIELDAVADPQRHDEGVSGFARGFPLALVVGLVIVVIIRIASEPATLAAVDVVETKDPAGREDPDREKYEQNVGDHVQKGRWLDGLRGRCHE